MDQNIMFLTELSSFFVYMVCYVNARDLCIVVAEKIRAFVMRALRDWARILHF